MKVLSNAFFDQVEVVQLDRWEHGPLELIFLDEFVDRSGRNESKAAGKLATRACNRFSEGMIWGWNSGYTSGLLRQPELLDWALNVVPALRQHANPNTFFVPRIRGYTELHMMLASVVPDEILRRHGVRKHAANFSLVPHLSQFCKELDKPGILERIRYEERHAKKANAAAVFAPAAGRAFEEYIWTRLTQDYRSQIEFFDPRSPLRLLAGDLAFWMSRLYRVAIERRETFEEVSEDDREVWWQPLDQIAREIRGNFPDEQQLSRYRVRRPLKGGTIWDPDDSDDCEAVVDEMLGGCGVMESLEEVLEILHSHPTHEDFSDRYSWIKEDFERSFYRKRAKLKVTLFETVDNFPAWCGNEPAGYDNILFRDLLAFFDRRDRHIIIACRQGKTVSEIACELGHNGHAAVSRRLAEIKSRLQKLLKADS